MRPRSIAVALISQIVSLTPLWGQTLTHGPVVGGVTASTAGVFVRTNQAASVTLRYGTDPNLRTYTTSPTFRTASSNDFTDIIPVKALIAQTTYYMNVVVDGIPQFASSYPSFTTFPSSASSRDFNFVVLTDFVTTHELTRPVQTFANAAAKDPAFAFIGGDFDHRNPKTLAAKREMFRDLYDANTPFMGEFVNLILHRTPIIHQWDDHDSGLNNVDKTYPYWNLTQQVFEEYVPSYPLPSTKPGIWQKFSYAQVECFVLDCRSQRDLESDSDNANKSMLDGNNLGAMGELRWLENGLLSSTAIWKIIFTSVVTNPTTKFPDGWAGYQTEWNALGDFIRGNKIGNVVFISGDLHLSAIDNGSASGFPEMCVQQPNGIGHCPTYQSPGVWSEAYAISDCSGYGIVSVLQNPDRLILQAADEFGNVKLSHTVMAQTANRRH